MEDSYLFLKTKKEVAEMSKGRVIKSIIGCNSVWKFPWNFVFIIYTIGAMAHEIAFEYTILDTSVYIGLLFLWFLVCVFDHYLYRKQEYELNTKIKLLEKIESRDNGNRIVLDRNYERL